MSWLRFSSSSFRLNVSGRDNNKMAESRNAEARRKSHQEQELDSRMRAFGRWECEILTLRRKPSCLLPSPSNSRKRDQQFSAQEQ